MKEKEFFKKDIATSSFGTTSGSLIYVYLETSKERVGQKHLKKGWPNFFQI